MTCHEQLNDDFLTGELRDSLSSVELPGRPPLEAIAARGRARQRRRINGYAGLGAAGIAASTALVLGLTGTFGSAPAPSTGTIRTAAFTLTHNTDGTDTLALTQRQLFNPVTLQRALRHDGIPALVKIGTYCSSDPAPPHPESIGVLSVQLPDGSPVGKSTPGRQVPIPPDTVTVINPAAMPAGTELFFDYLHHGLAGGLIYTRSYTCGNGLPPVGSRG